MWQPHIFIQYIPGSVNHIDNRSKGIGNEITKCIAWHHFMLVALQENEQIFLFTLAHMGGGYIVQYTLFVCVFVCVCVLPQNGCKIQLSQNLNKLHLTNLVTWDKQWFSTRQARQRRLKWQVKLKTKRLTVQISHERLLNQANTWNLKWGRTYVGIFPEMLVCGDITVTTSCTKPYPSPCCRSDWYL